MRGREGRERERKESNWSRVAETCESELERLVETDSRSLPATMLGSVQNLPPNKGPSIIQQQSQLVQQQQPQNGPTDVPPPPLNGQDFTLSNVLHFLQSEWRKYERDRNEWEIERAEMRVRRPTRPRPAFSYPYVLAGPHSSFGGRAPLLREYQS